MANEARESGLLRTTHDEPTQLCRVFGVSGSASEAPLTQPKYRHAQKASVVVQVLPSLAASLLRGQFPHALFFSPLDSLSRNFRADRDPRIMISAHLLRVQWLLLRRYSHRCSPPPVPKQCKHACESKCYHAQRHCDTDCYFAAYREAGILARWSFCG